MISFQFKRRLLPLFLIFGFGLAIALQSPILAQTTPPTVTELRGVWLTNIDSEVLFSRQNVTRSIRRLAAMNFNTLYPTVWNWGYTLYPSRVAEQVIGRSLDPTPGLQGRDMLREVVDRGHQRNMAVIPWFEFGFMAPADSDLAKRHPTWITSRRDGTQIVMEGTHPRVWLNPFLPDVQQTMLAFIREIVTNYDIDGIQFDDHFGLPAELGYDAYTVRLYRQETGRSAPTNFQDAAWTRWRADKITQFMSQVFFAIKAIKPDCIVSVSPNPQQFSYSAYLADWQRWERNGYIEELIVQVYRDSLPNFAAELDRPEVRTAQTHIPTAVGILAGLKNRDVPISQIRSQVQAARDRRLAGVSFFFYETLGQRDRDFRAMFPTVARRPTVSS